MKMFNTIDTWLHHSNTCHHFDFVENLGEKNLKININKHALPLIGHLHLSGTCQGCNEEWTPN